MATVLKLNFSQGSYKEQDRKTIPVNTSVSILRTDKGRAAWFPVGAALETFGVRTGIKTLALMINPSGNGDILLDNGTAKLTISGGNISGPGLTQCYVNNSDTDAISFNTWSLVIPEFSGGIDFSTDFEIDPTMSLFLAKVEADDGILDTAEREALWQDFLGAQNIETDPMTIGRLQYNENWEEVAPQLGTEGRIYSLAEHNGRLFGGTVPNGKLYRWNESNLWEEVAPQLGTEGRIYSMVEHNGRLFGGTSSNGKLYRWNESNLWEEVAPQLGAETHILSMVEHNGRLFGGTAPNGKLYRWNESNLWEEVASKLGTETYIHSMVEHNGRLFGGTSSNGKLYRWNESNLWEEVAPQLGAETYIYSMVEHNGRLFGGTYSNGKLYRWNESNLWEEVAPQLGAETYIHSMVEHNGRLFGGTVPNGKLYRWNESNLWEEVASKLGTETYIFSMAVHNGRLFGGTYSNGKLYRAQMPVGTDQYPLNPIVFDDNGLNWIPDGVTKTAGQRIGNYLVKSGSFFCIEDATGKKIECVTNGTLEYSGIKLPFVGGGFIRRLDGDLSGFAGGTVAAANPTIIAEDNTIKIQLISGQMIRNLTIGRDEY